MGTGDQTAFPKPNGKQEGRPKIWGVQENEQCIRNCDQQACFLETVSKVGSGRVEDEEGGFLLNVYNVPKSSTGKFPRRPPYLSFKMSPSSKTAFVFKNTRTRKHPLWKVFGGKKLSQGMSSGVVLSLHSSLGWSWDKRAEWVTRSHSK